jgi:hypothetical protein
VTFKERSKEIAERFLQTAVVVDDNAYAGDETVPDDLIVPEAGAIGNVATIDETQIGPTGAFNAEELSHAFVQLGIYSLILRPTLQRRITEPSFVRAIKQADLAVLDWRLVGDATDGEQTLNVLSEVFSDSEHLRSRVIAIYTAGTVLDQVVSEVANTLPGFSYNSYTLGCGHSKIVFYAKDGSYTHGEAADRIVSESALPGRLVEDFSEVTRGLLSNVALEAMARLRENTHRLLSRFHGELDAPYIAHRLLTTPPFEAADHIHPLIADELEAALGNGGISDMLTNERVLEYLISCKGEGKLDLSRIDADSDKAWGYLLRASDLGLECSGGDFDANVHKKFVDKEGRFKKDSYESIFKALEPAGNFPSADERFSMLLSLYGSYGPDGPKLGPGVILEETLAEGSKFWLCIQPSCDSVRLVGERKFIMLHLEKVEEKKAFDVITKDKSGVSSRLKVNRKLFDGDMPSFAPDPGTQTVCATRQGDSWEFVSVGGASFTYLATLKQAHASRLVQRAVGDLGRVGLTEHEWARRRGSS